MESNKSNKVLNCSYPSVLYCYRCLLRDFHKYVRQGTKIRSLCNLTVQCWKVIVPATLFSLLWTSNEDKILHYCVKNTDTVMLQINHLWSICSCIPDILCWTSRRHIRIFERESWRYEKLTLTCAAWKISVSICWMNDLISKMPLLLLGKFSVRLQADILVAFSGILERQIPKANYERKSWTQSRNSTHCSIWFQLILTDGMSWPKSSFDFP